MLPSAARASSTYYVATNGSDASAGTSSRPWATFAHAFASMAAGDTLIVKDGTYTERIHDPRSGSAGAYTVVKAEHDGAAVIDGRNLGEWETALDAYDCRYVRIEGFKFKGGRADGTGNGAAFLGGCDHIKLMRCAFYDPSIRSSVEDEGDPDYPGATNYHTFSMDRCSYMLLEDCWAWGYGRYRFESHESDHVIFRRCVGRYDRMHAHYPMAVFSIYRSPYNQLQNCMAIDCDQEEYYTGDSGFYGGLVSPNNGDDFSNMEMKVLGSIALNISAGCGFNSSITYGEQTLKDTVIWDCYGGIAYGVPNGADVSVDHVTVGDIYGTHEDIHPAGGVGAICWSDGLGTAVTNSLFTRCDQYGLFDFRGSDYNVFWDNVADFGNSYGLSHSVAGAHDRFVPHGLKYIVAPEAGSALDETASDGGDVGATVLNRYGVSGTLWGEAGFEQLTTASLWPWPNEARIRADMRSYAGPPSGARGFCADGMTLTRYIWEYLGNPMPSFAAAPTVASVAPSSGTTGDTVSITNLSGSGFQQGAQVYFVGGNGTPPSGADASSFGYSTTLVATEVTVLSQSRITCKLDLKSAPPGVYTARVDNPDGQLGLLENAFTVIPMRQATWYLPEGTSNWGFETYLSIANPSDRSVWVRLTYMTPEGSVPKPDFMVPAFSQTTVRPAEDLGASDFSTRIECLDGKAIAVDRTMSWTGDGAASPEAHSSVGVNAPAARWYLPEGSSKWGFESWLLVQNPNDRAANVELMYMTEDAGPMSFAKQVPANSRATFNMFDDIGERDASVMVSADRPVIPERAMYRNSRSEGHDSIGTTTAAREYYLAEGTSAWGFATYVLVQNPNAVEANVMLTYMTPEGAVEQPSFVMPPNSRKTVRANDALPGRDFSTRVVADVPVIAERAMYWQAAGHEACHDSIGVPETATRFFLPDGETSGGRETWTLVQNPNDTDVTVELRYLQAGGGALAPLVDTVRARSRKTYFMADMVPSGRASIVVSSKTAGKEIVVERAMYWNSRGAGTDTIGAF